jgi:hypothetical protein
MLSLFLLPIPLCLQACLPPSVTAQQARQMVQPLLCPCRLLDLSQKLQLEQQQQRALPLKQMHEQVPPPTPPTLLTTLPTTKKHKRVPPPALSTQHQPAPPPTKKHKRVPPPALPPAQQQPALLITQTRNPSPLPKTSTSTSTTYQRKRTPQAPKTSC